ncbi:MAG: hypothetical protein Q3997_07830 [Propionibacteriaceae bacterium]|nr:hypothetical protein [Propionibacteriaceae bacterium]
MSAQSVLVQDGLGVRSSARWAIRAGGVRVSGSWRAGGGLARPAVSRPASCRVAGAPGVSQRSGSPAWVFAGRALICAIFAFGLFVVVSSFLEFSNEPIVSALSGLG